MSSGARRDPRSTVGGAVRYPQPLRAGDTIGVTAPSAGVADALRPRLDFCVSHLRDLGYQVVVGDCMDGSGVTSAPASARAAELQEMLTDPGIGAVVPPWGGELAIDLLSLLDFQTLADAEPTWLVGYSDTSTLLMPVTLLTGVATVHAPNLMDTPFRVPEPLAHWLDVVTAERGAQIEQGPAQRHQRDWPDFAADARVTELNLDQPAGWKLLDPAAGSVQATGRLLGGCLETVAMLPGTPYGNLPVFVADHCPEGVLLYLEVAESSALVAARLFHHVRLAGWLDAASAVLIGRTPGPDTAGFTQHDALLSAFGDLDVPVVYDVDVGHLPPQLALVNGALATLSVDPQTQSLRQRLV